MTIDLYTQYGCALVAFLLVPYLWRTGAGLYAVLAPLFFGLSIFIFNAFMLVPDDMEWPVWASSKHFMLLVYACVSLTMLCNPPLFKDLIAITLWAILVLAEGYAFLFEDVLCNYAMGDQDGASEYICGRIFGPEFTSLPLVFFTAALAWVALKWRPPQTKTSGKS